MDAGPIAQVRRFNRLVTQRVEALQESYLRRGRPLGEARLIFETRAEGAELRALRDRLGLDSGYLSRLLRSLEAQGLVTVEGESTDRRRRWVRLTSEGRAELAAYDRLSDELAASMLAPLGADERARLLAAMAEIERLIRAATIKLRVVSPNSAAARRCLGAYFRELAPRFEGGFNPGEGDLASEEEMMPPNGFFVLAQIDGRAVGCGGLRRIDKRVGEIKRMWTAPEARGQGIARRVVQKLEALAREAGIETCGLTRTACLPRHRQCTAGTGIGISPVTTTIPTRTIGSRSSSNRPTSQLTG